MASKVFKDQMSFKKSYIFFKSQFRVYFTFAVEQELERKNGGMAVLEVDISPKEPAGRECHGGWKATWVTLVNNLQSSYSFKREEIHSKIKQLTSRKQTNLDESVERQQK